MPNLTEKTQVANFFKDVIQKEKGVKIKSVFSFEFASWKYLRGHRIYAQDADIYIMFEDLNCLIISFLGIDKFDVEYRKLKEKEQAAIYKRKQTEDYFNREDALYKNLYNTTEKTETQLCFLEYGALNDVEVFIVDHPYEKWVNGKIHKCDPTSETFYKIKLLMDNGKSINIKAEPAIYDGYMDIWSEDTIELVVPVK